MTIQVYRQAQNLLHSGGQSCGRCRWPVMAALGGCFGSNLLRFDKYWVQFGYQIGYLFLSYAHK